MCVRTISPAPCTSNRSSLFGFQFTYSRLAAFCLIATITMATSSALSAQSNDKWLKEGLPDNIVPKAPDKKSDDPADGIPRAARAQLENKILPALVAGNDGEFLDAMMRLVSKQPSGVIEKVEKSSSASGFGSLREQFSETLIRSVSRGLQIQTKSLRPALVQYATAGIMEMIEAELEELENHDLMKDPLVLPGDWMKTEKLFWDAHVWRNRFINMDRLLTFAKTVQKPLLDRALKADDDGLIDKYRKLFVIEQRIRSIYRALNEREAEFRLQGLAKAEAILRLDQDIENRLNAGFALELHGGELDLFFRNQSPGSFERERLNDESILKECEQLLVSGRNYGKEIIPKAMLLRTGAHWWLRGRYGRSTQAYGLLKPVESMRSKEAMFGLFMPKERPQAIGYIDSESGYESPGFDRRHFYTWAIERRDVIRSLTTDVDQSRSKEKIRDIGATTFW